MAANTGMVATAVNTTLADVSTMPRVNVTEFMLKVTTTHSPGQLTMLRKSCQGWRVNKAHQMASDMTPIKMPRQPINDQRSSSDRRITNVSGVKIRMPASASNVPKRPGVSRM